MSKKPWYFASPYTAPTPEEEEENYTFAFVEAAELIRMGYVIFSPIIHSHFLNRAVREPKEFWYAFDRVMIDSTDWEGLILGSGWERSGGCKMEHRIFTCQRLPVLTVAEAINIAREGKDEKV